MKLILVVAALVTLGLWSSCGSDGSHEGRGGSANATTAIVVGTVVDAATGAPVADVKVEGPNDRSTRTDFHGRFELKNLEVGTQGEVKATAEDGRKGRIALRPLAAGRLEVVLHLTAR
jgi:hypothetical protein